MDLYMDVKLEMEWLERIIGDPGTSILVAEDGELRISFREELRN